MDRACEDGVGLGRLCASASFSDRWVLLVASLLLLQWKQQAAQRRTLSFLQNLLSPSPVGRPREHIRINTPVV
ncbi:hypothetical protein CBW46_016705 [Paenibacillus xerothermodurans]|uniref:Uncharacterized protein n=1 Tax=Paenibacillus xerothermodurans TaxID=1977292 RepID=A0A2W1N7H6_PAEXE|nr:hypothetical protein CBW46_016705 [Paenibacillus xerothermodurans]